ncbi:single-stranded DNA-binding protein [Dermatophilaceae bacterium Sec6.4]
MAEKKNVKPSGGGGVQQAVPTSLNEVRLVGRVSAPAKLQVMPSGDELVTFRLILDRPQTAKRSAGARQSVDVIEIACWTSRTRRAALNLIEGATVGVEGGLRRRFYKTPVGAASRYEVEAAVVSRVRKAPGAASQ